MTAVSLHDVLFSCFTWSVFSTSQHILAVSLVCSFIRRATKDMHASTDSFSHRLLVRRDIGRSESGAESALPTALVSQPSQEADGSSELRKCSLARKQRYIFTTQFKIITGIHMNGINIWYIHTYEFGIPHEAVSHQKAKCDEYGLWCYVSAN